MREKKKHVLTNFTALCNVPVNSKLKHLHIPDFEVSFISRQNWYSNTTTPVHAWRKQDHLVFFFSFHRKWYILPSNSTRSP